jgi:hypothetical protein
MEQINNYILSKIKNETNLTEKLKIDKTPISQQPYDFEIDLDSMQNANACMNSIKKIFGETGIEVEDGPYSNVIYTGKTIDDFLKVCGLISVTYNVNGPDEMIEFNGDSDDDMDLAFYIPSEYYDTIEDYYDEIKEYAKKCIKWLKNNEISL